MPVKTTLAAGVTAALFISALLGQDTSITYCYVGTVCPPKPTTDSVAKTPAIAACDAHSTAPTAQAMLNASQALGVTQMDATVCWLRIAAAQGDSSAQGTLATIFLTGLNGVPVDLKEALEFAIKAADGHNYLGETCLAVMYAKGMGLEKDEAKADFWQQAADRDELAAKQSKDNQAPKQTSSQPPVRYGPNGDQPLDRTQTVAIPLVMHFCAQHCLTFTLEKDGTLVNNTLLTGQRNVRRVLRIDSFTHDSVVIDRTDYGDFPGHGLMKGKMQYGNSSAIGEGWALSWGNELDQLPGSDQERAQRAGNTNGQPNIGAMLNQRGPSGLTPLDALRLFFGGSSEDSQLAEYNRLNDRCISKGDYATCQSRDTLRETLRENGVAIP